MSRWCVDVLACGGGGHWISIPFPLNQDADDQRVVRVKDDRSSLRELL